MLPWAGRWSATMSESGYTKVELPAFTRLVDLASARLGGVALAASDEFFAPMVNLLQPGRGVFKPDEYTERGKWMDGWETRRKRTPGHDWCVIRLGLPGIIRGVDIDTHHFVGNHPPHASLDAAALANPSPGGDLPGDNQWTEVLGKSALEPDARNLLAVTHERHWSHVRLNIYPDGGVARLRVHGTMVPDSASFGPDETIDLVAVENGGIAMLCSDMFFSNMQNLIMPGPARNMGDGWETRRRRGPGFDWAIIRLGQAGTIQRVVLETTHFKGNYPAACSLEVCHEPKVTEEDLVGDAVTWQEILPRTKLRADHSHDFAAELRDAGACTHLRLNIYPDGGVARLRAFGVPESKGAPPSGGTD